VALVLADARVDARCEYPSADEILARARELENPGKEEEGSAV